MLKNIAGVILGMVVGMAANMAVIAFSWTIYPLPEGLDMNDSEALAAFIGTLPAGAFALAMLAHLAQAGLGGWVAARVSSSGPVRQALIVGFLSSLGGLINLLTIPGPMWMWIELPLYFVVAWAAGRQVARALEASEA